MKYDDETRKLCEKLGAPVFQRVVFIAEKVKYFIIRKLFPNIVQYYNKKCDQKRDKLLENCSDDNQRVNIKNYYKYEKLKFKREINTEKNRNYHLNELDPSEIINYLSINKNIHTKGLKSNGVIAFIVLVLSLIFSNPFPTISLIILIFEGISALVNFECINLQNYNLCRFSSEKAQKTLKSVKDRQTNRMQKQYGDGIKVIAKTFAESDDIPEVNEVINNIKSKDEVTQLLNYAKAELDKKKKVEDRKLEKRYK